MVFSHLPKFEKSMSDHDLQVTFHFSMSESSGGSFALDTERHEKCMELRNDDSTIEMCLRQYRREMTCAGPPRRLEVLRQMLHPMSSTWYATWPCHTEFNGELRAPARIVKEYMQSCMHKMVRMLSALFPSLRDYRRRANCAMISQWTWHFLTCTFINHQCLHIRHMSSQLKCFKTRHYLTKSQSFIMDGAFMKAQESCV